MRHLCDSNVFVAFVLPPHPPPPAAIHPPPPPGSSRLILRLLAEHSGLGRS